MKRLLELIRRVWPGLLGLVTTVTFLAWFMEPRPNYVVTIQSTAGDAHIDRLQHDRQRLIADDRVDTGGHHGVLDAGRAGWKAHRSGPP